MQWEIYRCILWLQIILRTNLSIDFPKAETQIILLQQSEKFCQMKGIVKSMTEVYGEGMIQNAKYTLNSHQWIKYLIHISAWQIVMEYTNFQLVLIVILKRSCRWNKIDQLFLFTVNWSDVSTISMCKPKHKWPKLLFRTSFHSEMDHLDKGAAKACNNWVVVTCYESVSNDFKDLRNWSPIEALNRSWKIF